MAFVVGAGQAQTAPDLGEPPPAPKDVSGLPRRVGPLSVTGGFTVNIASREEVRSFFNAVYRSSEGVPMNSSAVVASCVAGTNATAFLQAELRRINWFRAMAGVPANVSFAATNNTRCQQAALMMARNNTLSHYPPSSWFCYTSDGALAAQNSNLALGTSGAAAITGYMQDFGAVNAPVGHRRWLLYPQTQIMGGGDVPAQSPFNDANATWVFDGHYFDPRPPTRTPYVSWPPPGFTPYQVVFPRWSFSYPGANFTNATITMTSNGVPVTVFKESVVPGAGENTVVWVPMGLDPNNFATVFPFNGSDTVYTVTISNIVGMPQSTYTYNVTVFDPAVPGADFYPPVISGPSQPLVGGSNFYTFNAVSNATGYQWRASLRWAYALADGAEGGTTNWDIVTTTNYNPRVSSPYPVASGSFAFNLRHPMPPGTDMLTLKQVFVPRTNGLLTFRSRLTWAYFDEYAKVQVSTNGGITWVDVYSQQGTGGQGETSFTLRSVSLTNFAGRPTQLRFNYVYVVGGQYFPWTNPGDGWTIDDIVITNADALTPLATNATTTTNFVFTPAQATNYNLEVRALIFTEFPLDWGPARQVSAVAPPLVIQLAAPLLTNNQVWIPFTVVSGSAATFKLLHADQPQGPWTTNTAATLTTNTPGVSYRFTAPVAANAKFYRVQSP
ncbi:MAG: CAP domain-containing protein [Verrucomicrobiae bacterium]|nr:CAP domain-containing protein [Verrucomicrobiae bacterium]